MTTKTWAVIQNTFAWCRANPRKKAAIVSPEGTIVMTFIPTIETTTKQGEPNADANSERSDAGVAGDELHREGRDVNADGTDEFNRGDS